MTHHRDIHKIHAFIFMQRLYAYLVILKYFELLSKVSGNLISKTEEDYDEDVEIEGWFYEYD